MGNKHWFEGDPQKDIDRHLKMLQGAKEFQEKRKKEDKKRLENIKNRWFAHEKLSAEDTTWLIMKMEKSLYKWEG